MPFNLSLLNYVNDMTNLILVNVFFCFCIFLYSPIVTSGARYHSANDSRLKTKKAVNLSYANRPVNGYMQGEWCERAKK